jgi:hypothetical protein
MKIVGLRRLLSTRRLLLLLELLPLAEHMNSLEMELCR